MADPFVAEIRIFPYTFAPQGWATCDGQLLPISQNTALFSLLGTTYGGNGQVTFALPNLQGRAPMHPGQGSGLSPRFLGDTGGSRSVTLLASEMPGHTHALTASLADANASTPADELPATGIGVGLYDTVQAPSSPMSPDALTPVGGGLPHNNMMPYTTFTFCIALQGIFPPRP